MSKQADDVLESGAKIMTKSNVLKNTTNTIKSNMTPRQIKTIQNAGEEVAQRVRQEAAQAANSVVGSRTAQNAMDNIHPEVAATYTRGGGSRGRSGNRGYSNNRSRYSQNNQSINLGQNAYHQKIKQNVINLNRQQKAMNNVPSGNQAASNVVNANTTKKFNMGTLSKDDSANFQSAMNNIIDGGGSTTYRAPGGSSVPIYSGTTSAGNSVNLSTQVQQSLNINTNPKKFDMGTLSKEDSADFQSAMNKIIDDGNNTVPNANQMPIVNQSMNTGPTASPYISQNIHQNAAPNPQQASQPQFNTGNSPQGNVMEPQFNLGNSTPESVDPLDNQTRPKLGEGIDWKGVGGKAKEFFTGGFTDTYANYKANGGSLTDAVKSAYTNDDGSLRLGRIAGSYMAAAAGVRVLSGGGVTKDRNGNNNLIGVPFI